MTNGNQNPIEDIFEDVDQGAPPAVQKPAGEVPAQVSFNPAASISDPTPQMEMPQAGPGIAPPTSPAGTPTSPRNSWPTSIKVVIIIVIIIAVSIIGFSLYYFFFQDNNNLSTNESNNNLNTNDETNQNQNLNINLNQNTNLNTNSNVNSNSNLNTNVNSNANTNQPLDQDNDDLPDSEEATLGTDPKSPDSDGDGMFDYEEVKIYFTDPLNPDTDGDGYEDGEEVKNGFNPNGTGTIINLNT